MAMQGIVSFCRVGLSEGHSNFLSLLASLLPVRLAEGRGNDKREHKGSVGIHLRVS